MTQQQLANDFAKIGVGTVANPTAASEFADNGSKVSIDGASITVDDFEDESLSDREPKGIWMAMVQAGTVLIFLAGVIGAFYYAINNAEMESYNKPPKIDWQNISGNYSALFSQFSASGTISLTFESMEDEHRHKNQTSLQFPSFWYQDDDKREIVHKYSNQRVAHVRHNATFWLILSENGDEAIECMVDASLNYMSYLSQLGLLEMEDRHSEFREARGGHVLYVFDNQPEVDMDAPLPPLYPDAKSGEPILVQAFADSETGAFLGWQTYYTYPAGYVTPAPNDQPITWTPIPPSPNETSNALTGAFDALKVAIASDSEDASKLMLRRVEYWYPGMTRGSAQPPAQKPSGKSAPRPPELPDICGG